ncbi:MAG: hypothetical protein JEZ11_01625 [Desulfobacterales bacterium]|nr:hypothetical protein [Desulfobacterales bacterium]
MPSNNFSPCVGLDRKPSAIRAKKSLSRNDRLYRQSLGDVIGLDMGNFNRTHDAVSGWRAEPGMSVRVKNPYCKKRPKIVSPHESKRDHSILAAGIASGIISLWSD